MNIEKIAGKIAKERILFASFVETPSFNMFAKLSDDDKAKVVEKVKEKVKGTSGGEETPEDKSVEKTPEDKSVEKTPKDKSKEIPDKTPEDKSTETSDGTPKETPDETPGDNDLTSVVDGIAQEIEQIKSDGQVTPGEVMGLLDNMMSMVTNLLKATPGKEKKTASNRQIRIALKLGSDLSQGE